MLNLSTCTDTPKVYQHSTLFLIVYAQQGVKYRPGRLQNARGVCAPESCNELPGPMATLDLWWAGISGIGQVYRIGSFAIAIN